MGVRCFQGIAAVGGGAGVNQRGGFRLDGYLRTKTVGRGSR